MLLEFKSILDLTDAFPNESACIKHLETVLWEGKLVSPFDPESKVYKCKDHKYKCRNTGKYFNVKHGTIFENSNVCLRKWFLALYLFSSHKKGISAPQLASDIGVSKRSAWFMLHRLRYAFDHPMFKQTLGKGNPVEVDETWIGGKEKNKHAHKRIKVGGGPGGKIPVMGMIEREGYLIAKVIRNTSFVTLIPTIKNNVTEGAIVMTDEHKSYTTLRRKYDHRKVNHKAKQYVDGSTHTNTIENFWSNLKRGITGIYHVTSKVHLQAYVNEYSFRFNTRKMNVYNRFNLILSNVSGRLTYKQLTG